MVDGFLHRGRLPFGQIGRILLEGREPECRGVASFLHRNFSWQRDVQSTSHHEHL